MIENEGPQANNRRSSEDKTLLIELLKKKFSANEDSDMLSDILAEMNKANELKLCKICHDRERNATLGPCGHFVSCLKCTTSLKQCPICRTVISNISKTHLS